MSGKGAFTITNNVTGKVYVGSSNTDLDQRINYYWENLLLGIHHNEELQSDFNFYGSENFFINVISKNCQSENEVRQLREQLIYENRFNTYNHDVPVTYNGGNPNASFGGSDKKQNNDGREFSIPLSPKKLINYLENNYTESQNGFYSVFGKINSGEINDYYQIDYQMKIANDKKIMQSSGESLRDDVDENVDFSQLMNEDGRYSIDIDKGKGIVETIEADSIEELMNIAARKVMNAAIPNTVENCISEGDYEEAFDWIYRGLNNDPDDNTIWKLAYESIAKALDDGEYDEIMNLIIQLDGFEEDDFLLNSLGFTFMTKKDYETALKCFFEATQINPYNDVSWFLRGITVEYYARVCLNLGDYINYEKAKNNTDEALKCIEKAISLSPKMEYINKHDELLSLKYNL